MQKGGLQIPTWGVTGASGCWNGATHRVREIMSFFILFDSLFYTDCRHALLCLLNERPVSILVLPGTVVAQASAACMALCLAVYSYTASTKRLHQLTKL